MSVLVWIPALLFAGVVVVVVYRAVINPQKYREAVPPKPTIVRGESESNEELKSDSPMRSSVQIDVPSDPNSDFRTLLWATAVIFAVLTGIGVVALLFNIPACDQIGSFSEDCQNRDLYVYTVIGAAGSAFLSVMALFALAIGLDALARIETRLEKLMKTRSD